MKKHLITKHRTLLGYVLDMILIWLVILAVVLLAQFDQRVTILLLTVGPGAVILLLGLGVWHRRRLLRVREAAITSLALAHNLGVDPSGESFTAWHRASLLSLRGVKDSEFRNVVTGSDWTYGDFSYTIYGRTKYGDYKRAIIHYGFITTELPRIVPHLFFDSHKARGRQFRLHFARGQQARLEGGFEKYFTTYFPAGYTIDSLSIISPDVMLALQEAVDYDIEIVGNRVFLYGPLYDPAQQIPDMAAKLQKIKKELLDNILTYRDERLPFADGRQRVSIKGMSLKISRFWLVFGILANVAVVILWLLLEMWD
jgi:hypothetical protein